MGKAGGCTSMDCILEPAPRTSWPTWSPDTLNRQPAPAERGRREIAWVATLGAGFPARGVNPSEDDIVPCSSPRDGAYFALEQTFTLTGAHLQDAKGDDGRVCLLASRGHHGPAGGARAMQAVTSGIRKPGHDLCLGTRPGRWTQPDQPAKLAWIKPRADAG